ncbi:MAG TPA: VOC family protein, partial [Pseudomonadales bacterium]|nr:VOC family protein [Pseudomonadales bacterium]
MSVYRVGFVTIFVTDLAQALAFYQGKLGMKPVYQDPLHAVALMDNEGATLILQQAEPRSE